MASTAAARRPATSAPGDGSRTILVTDSQPIEGNNTPNAGSPNGILKLRGGTRSRPRVMWDADVIDNEGCGKKKSKICCIYHKPKRFDESSSESSGDESDTSCGSGDNRKHAHKRPDNAGDPNPGPNAYEKGGSKGKRKAYTSMSRFQSAITRLLTGQSKFELVHRPSVSWPSGAHISVLDSSFNPPTNAHAALASQSTSNPRLLLLSISNVDKVPKKGDATSVQRLEMMVALAERLGDVGVGAINEPTFVGKATILRECLDAAELTFLMGWDTITRFFAPRYYPSPQDMLVKLRTFFNDHRSSLICARRGSHPDPEEQAFLHSEYVREFYDAGKITIVDLDKQVRDISSTDVRNGTIETAERDCPKEVVDIIKREKLYF
ncbi:unnamed protein product [Rhizoctonia solani]|nr:unnamed protein product [Rhizoctonia solani]